MVLDFVEQVVELILAQLLQNAFAGVVTDDVRDFDSTGTGPEVGIAWSCLLGRVADRQVEVFVADRVNDLVGQVSAGFVELAAIDVVFQESID